MYKYISKLTDLILCIKIIEINKISIRHNRINYTQNTKILWCYFNKCPKL
jgi:hypothetical protein